MKDAEHLARIVELGRSLAAETIADLEAHAGDAPLEYPVEARFVASQFVRRYLGAKLDADRILSLCEAVSGQTVHGEPISFDSQLPNCNIVPFEPVMVAPSANYQLRVMPQRTVAVRSLYLDAASCDVLDVRLGNQSLFECPGALPATLFSGHRGRPIKSRLVKIGNDVFVSIRNTDPRNTVRVRGALFGEVFEGGW